MASQDPQLSAVALVCSLKASPEASSSQLLAEQVLTELAAHQVSGSLVRVADHHVAAGVETDMGEADEWPLIRRQILDADILVLATPTWMGQHSSVAQRVLERLDAELSDTDDNGQMHTAGKVAIAAIVGNEDGAHHISGIFFQALNDVGFTLAGQAVTYWNDAVAGDYRDYKDLTETPAAVAETTATVAAHAAHLARLLRRSPFPPTNSTKT